MPAQGHLQGPGLCRLPGPGHPCAFLPGSPGWEPGGFPLQSPPGFFAPLGLEPWRVHVCGAGPGAGHGGLGWDVAPLSAFPCKCSLLVFLEETIQIQTVTSYTRVSHASKGKGGGRGGTCVYTDCPAPGLLLAEEPDPGQGALSLDPGTCPLHSGDPGVSLCPGWGDPLDAAALCRELDQDLVGAGDRRGGSVSLRS